jgi:hypothetical protein
MEEVWRPMYEFEENYEASNFGKIRNSKTQECLKYHLTKKGYLQVNLCKNGVKSVKLVHRLIYPSFYPYQNKQIDHKDQNKTNNHIDNLRWVSQTENQHNTQKRQFCSSKYKGVSWNKNRNKWVAYVNMDRRIHLGYFNVEEEAGRAYDAYIIKHLADFGVLNFSQNN